MLKITLPIADLKVSNIRGPLLSCVLLLNLLLPSIAQAGRGRALFSLDTVAGPPFPSDLFAVADPSQNLGLRINLPKPDCLARPSDCEDLDVINTLDGFNLQPRLSIPFDGPIDVNSVNSETVFLISLGNTLDGNDRGGRRVGINQVVWDPATNTLHVESDEQLDQHTRYGLIVTNGLRDSQGKRIKASEAFRAFRQEVHGDYKRALLKAIRAAQRVGVEESEIVTASVFTTQSVTAILEKIRDQIKAATPTPADFRLGHGGARSVFLLSAVTGITFKQHTGVTPTVLTDFTLPVALLRAIPDVVGQIAFGKYLSPDYEVHPAEFTPVGTLTGTPAVQRVNEVFFNLYLPSGAPPPSGWPVAIFGHGSAGNKNNQPMGVAATMAKHGIATIAINSIGNGFGPLGTLAVSLAGGGSVTFPAGGRGTDQNNDNRIAESEGRGAPPPRTILAIRDGQRQTIVDLMQLVRVIQVGMDVDGDGFPDLDPSRIYYFGHSSGSNSGTLLLAVEPSIQAGVLNVPGTPTKDLRLSPGGRPGIGNFFAGRTPSLINAPGLTEVGGVTVGPPYFDENLPLRGEPPVINTVAGAMEIQELLDRMM